MNASRASVVVLALLSQIHGSAQQTPSPSALAASNEVTQLSPFVVDTSQDLGYQAGNTTSGSRLNAKLKDTAAAIQVFTPEFIQDLGANSLEQILGYAANVQKDIGDQAAGFGGAQLGRPDTGQQDFVFTQRGLDTTRGRNFFNTAVPIDNYNTERLELSSGPNSVLFGLGSAGGMVNSDTKRAELHRSQGGIRFQIGSYDFWRTEADWNQVLIQDKLAIRGMGVAEESKGWRHWDYSEQIRGTGAVIYRPFKHTTLFASYENGNSRRHLTLPWNAEDGLSLWLANGRPTRSGLWVAANAATEQPLGMTTLGATTLNTLIDNNGMYVNFRNLRQSAYVNLSLPATARPTDQTLVPPSLMPYDYSFSGPASFYRVRFNVANLLLEQQFTPTLSAQFAYNRERSFIDKNFAFGTQLKGDPNQQVTNSAGVLVANPYAGRLYLEDTWDYGTSRFDNEAMRASVAKELNLQKWGRYRLAVMAQHAVENTETNDYVEALVDSNNRPIGATLTGVDNRLTRRHYVTEGDYSTYYISDFRTPFTGTINGVNYHSQWVSFTPNQMDLSKASTNTCLLALQSYFFHDKLVGTLGFRRDAITYRRHVIETVTAADPRVTGGKLLAGELAFGTNFEENKYNPTTRTFGVVWHALPIASLFYNHANNVGVPSFRSTIFPDGRIGPPSDGRSHDMGFMFDPLEGKAFLRVTYFESRSDREVGANIQNLVTAPRNRINTALMTRGLITASEFDAWNVVARSALVDRTAKGWEANLTTNLTRNWALQANYSYTDTHRTNFFAEFEPWLATAEEFWNAKLRAGGLTSSQVTTATAASQGSIQDEIAFMKAGVADQRDIYEMNYGLRPHKATVFTRYVFNEGRLRNVFLGGGVRYQSTNVIQADLITGRIYTGEALVVVDALAGYTFSRPIFARNTKCRVQLNITNLLDDSDPIIGRYNSNFTGIKRVILRDPRMIKLTTSLNF